MDRLVADMTYFWRWGPHDAESLTVSRLLWWAEQAQRLSKARDVQ